MTIDRFTREDFEAALPVHSETGEKLWVLLGMDRGELSYVVPVPKTNKRIVVRSSVRSDGRAAGTGADSIRHWVEYWYEGDWRPLSKGRKAYTTRVPGWAERMREMLRKLWGLAVADSKKYGKYGEEYDVHGTFEDSDDGGDDGGGDPLSPTEQSRAGGAVEQDRDDDRGLRADVEAPGGGEAGGAVEAGADLQEVPGSDDGDPFGFLGEEVDGGPESPREEAGDGGDVRDGDGQGSKSSSDPFGFLGGESSEPEADPADDPEPEEASRHHVRVPKDVAPNAKQQEAIGADFDIPLRVLAPPGSGKTFTIIRRYAAMVESGISPDSIVMVTFTRDMADELLAKAMGICPEIEGTSAQDQITTIHALCYRILKAEGLNRRVPKWWKEKRQLQDIIEEVWDIPHYRPGWKEVKSYIDSAKFQNLDVESSMKLFGPVRDQWDRPVGHQLQEAYRLHTEWLERNRFLTFADMLFLVEQKMGADRKFLKRWQGRLAYFIIDEGQDTSGQAMRILTRLAQPQDNVTIVGDTDQCVLEGEPVTTLGGEIAVEDVPLYSKVVAATGSGKSAERHVVGKSKREGEFWIVTVETESGHIMRVTHNHQCFASFPNRSVHTRFEEDRHWVYLMYRRGFGYRVGVTKNPRNRLNGENADKLWLIESCDSRAEAQYWEHIIASRYGIPRLTFEDHNPSREGGGYMDSEWIARFFQEIDTHTLAHRFAELEGFKLDTGAHVVAQARDPRVVLYVTMCASRNTATPTHTLRVTTSNDAAIEALEKVGITLTPAKQGKRYRLVTSDVRHLQEIAGLIQESLGCEVVVKTNFISNDDLDGYSLNPIMMPAGNILPGFYVPVYRDGKVVLDKVVKVSKVKREATVYDLEIDGVANFFVGGICTHNTLFRFAGATPEVNLYGGFEGRYPDGITIKLSVNYRSTKAIINYYSDLIRYNYGENAPYDLKYLKDVQAMPGAAEGDPVTFEMYGSAVEEGAAVARSIKEMIDSGEYGPGDFFVGARTRAQTGYLEGPLVQLGVPYINLVGSSFWGLSHINDVVSYLRLAYDKSDSEAFQRVYRIASVDMVHPWGDDKGNYCHHRYLGKAFLQKCYDGDAGGPLYRWASRAARSRRSWMPGVRDMQFFVDRLTAVMCSEGPAQAIQFIIEECYESYLKAEEGIVGEDAAENGKLDDLQTVVDIAREFDTTADFLQYVEGAREAAEAAKQGDWEDHVVISTIHRLKGQERPVVFGVGCVEGRDKRGLPIGLLPHTYSMRPPENRGVLPTGGMGRIEDERDIMYVLVSRAEREVHLTGCYRYRKQSMGPSRFIDEMGLLK